MVEALIEELVEELLKGVKQPTNTCRFHFGAEMEVIADETGMAIAPALDIVIGPKAAATVTVVVIVAKSAVMAGFYFVVASVVC